MKTFSIRTVAILVHFWLKYKNHISREESCCDNLDSRSTRTLGIIIRLGENLVIYTVKYGQYAGWEVLPCPQKKANTMFCFLPNKNTVLLLCFAQRKKIEFAKHNCFFN